ncbi:hypothetical protein CspHIS471_0610980 [Cutaneotrichosporon sp. HIS471]|nr:hypothetical protein CspHIS471_0610980 [Cutaneotrichosporon sp. HIS471]
MLKALASHMVEEYLPSVKTTIVVFEHLWGPGEGPEGFRAHLQSMDEDMAPANMARAMFVWLTGHNRELLDDVVFLSFEDWCAEVGPERVALEATWEGVLEPKDGAACIASPSYHTTSLSRLPACVEGGAL